LGLASIGMMTRSDIKRRASERSEGVT